MDDLSVSSIGSTEAKLDRPIGLIGATAMVVGAVIGMGIYALIAKVAAQVGTTLWFPFIMSMVITLIGIIPIIQIAAALPRAGAGYIYTSRLLHPLIGTVVSWVAILSAACSSVYVSIGISGYIAPYLPFHVPIELLSLLLPACFLVLYLFGLKLASSLQVLMTAILIVALMIYGIKGSFSTSLKVTTSLPMGGSGLIMATIISYNAWLGFAVVTEIGEEIRDAKRNIPLSIIIGGFIILIIYVLVGTVFTNSVPYDFEAIDTMTAPLIDTGKVFLSPFFVWLLSFGALAGALTSFNAAAIAMPREFFSQARDGIAPGVLAKVSEQTKSPINAVVAYFGIVFLLLILGIIFDLEIGFFASMCAQGFLLMALPIAIASLRLSKKFPEYFEKTYFRIPRPLLWIIVVMAILSNIGFFIISMSEIPATGVVLLIFAAVVAIFHLLRVNTIKKKGIDWEERVREIPGFDEE